MNRAGGRRNVSKILFVIFKASASAREKYIHPLIQIHALVISASLRLATSLLVESTVTLPPALVLTTLAKAYHKPL